MRQPFVQNGAQKYNGERSSLSGWFGTPQGAYVLGWELAQFDSAVDDVFGFRAVQVGLPEVDFLRQNRIRFRFTLALEPGAAIAAELSSSARLLAATSGAKVIFMFIESSFVNLCTSSNNYGKDVAIEASKGVLIRFPLS